jgi:ribose/xylose/arabinose/galactoside ABC-type transport system permease subunit
MKVKKSSKDFFTSKTFSLLLVIAVLLVIFTVASGGLMLKPLNIRNIINNMVLLSFLGIGAGMLMLFGDIDLSAGSIGSFAGCVLAIAFMDWGIPTGFAYILAMIVGALGGFINAFLVNELHFQSFIATLCTSSVLQGFGLMLVTGQGLKVKGSATINWIGDTKFFGGMLPVTIIIALLFVLVYGIILSKTRFGRTIYLCGGNRFAAYLSDLYPKRLSYILFMNSGFLAAVSGSIYVSNVKTAYATSIASYQFTGLTAAILGGVAFGGGSGGMLGCFLGMLILAVFNTGVTTLGIDYNFITIFNGVLLVFGLSLDAISARRKSRQVLKQSLRASTNAATGVKK